MPTLQDLKTALETKMTSLEAAFDLNTELSASELDYVTGQIDQVVETVNPNAPPRPTN